MQLNLATKAGPRKYIKAFGADPDNADHIDLEAM
jgi:hypothetical protein